MASIMNEGPVSMPPQGDRKPKEAHLVQVDESPVDETEWFAIRIRVQGKHIQVHVNDQQVVDYTEPETPERPASRAKRLIDPNGRAIALFPVPSPPYPGERVRVRGHPA